MKKLLWVSAVAFFASNCFAFIAEPSVKGAAMGGAYAAGAGDDIFAASFNPASPINGLGQLGLAFHKRESAEDIFSVGGGQNLPAGFQVQAFGNYLYENHSADIMRDYEAKLGVAWNLGRLIQGLPVSVGANVKSGWVNVGDYHDSALTADLGVVATLFPYFTTGLYYDSFIGNLKNIYTRNTWALGFSYDWVINPDNSLDFRLDLGKDNKNGRTSFGVEYNAWRVIFLRGGYIKETQLTKNFTWGVGVGLGSYGRIDAAYLPYDYGKTYKISYVVPFGFKGGDSVLGPQADVNPYYEGSGSSYAAPDTDTSIAAAQKEAADIKPVNEVHNVIAGAALPAEKQPASSGARDVTPTQPAVAQPKAPREVYVYPNMQYDDGSVAALKAINARKNAIKAAKTARPKRVMAAK